MPPEVAHPTNTHSFSLSPAVSLLALRHVCVFTLTEKVNFSRIAFYYFSVCSLTQPYVLLLSLTPVTVLPHSIFLSICLAPVPPSGCLSICLSFSQSALPLSIPLPICVSVYLSVCLVPATPSVCVSVYLSIYLSLSLSEIYFTISFSLSAPVSLCVCLSL